MDNIIKETNRQSRFNAGYRMLGAGALGKECSNYRTIALISHTSKVMLKILQARFQQYVNRELPDSSATGDANVHGVPDCALPI